MNEFLMVFKCFSVIGTSVWILSGLWLNHKERGLQLPKNTKGFNFNK